MGFCFIRSTDKHVCIELSLFGHFMNKTVFKTNLDQTVHQALVRTCTS